MFNIKRFHSIYNISYIIILKFYKKRVFIELAFPKIPPIFFGFTFRHYLGGTIRLDNFILGLLVDFINNVAGLVLIRQVVFFVACLSFVYSFGDFN